LEEAKTGKGWRIRIGRVLIRVMNEGGGRTNYFRVSIEGKGPLNEAGHIDSENPGATHMKITDDAFERIMRILRKSGYYHG
jgi:hypothetical protein